MTDDVQMLRRVAQMVALRTRLGQHLTAIVDLYADLEDEAAHRFDDNDIPGGDALVMLGPAANLTTWQTQVDAAEQLYFEAIEDGRKASWPEISDHDSDPAPPLLVLATWEDAVRDARNQPTGLRATVERAADYLRNSIDWMLSEDENDEPNFIAVDQLARDLAHLRTRLESILKSGEQVDRGVPCVTCGKALFLDWGATEEEDRWRCRTCATWSSREQYKLAIKADYRRNAEWLTAADMAEEYRIPRGSISAWAADGFVRKRRDTNIARIVYSVQDALARRGENLDSVSL